MDLKKITLSVVDLAKEAGAFIRSKANADLTIETKGLHNFVTEVDKLTEKFIIEGLKRILPESGFLAEEQTSSAITGVFDWIIDPLDGTTNFIHGLFPVAVSIALTNKNSIISGVIYEVGADEVFYAYDSGGAFLNGKRIQVTSVKKISDSLLATGFPFSNYSRLENFMETLKYFMKNSHGLRRLGSAATDLAYVACGRFDGFYEYALNPWDVAAGDIIVREAGGKTADFSGGKNHIFGREIIASNPYIFEEFLGVLTEIMC